MSIRKRKWKTSKGDVREAWVADFFDGAGNRVQKMHRTRKEAEAFLNQSKVAVSEGTFIADRDTITVVEAGKMWIRRCTDEGLERATIRQYTQHLDLHIKPYIGNVKLNKLNVPAVTQFRSRLQQEGRSRSMVRGVLTSLSSIITDAQALGYAARNPVREARRMRKERGAIDERHREQLLIGRDIPSRDEMRAIIKHARGGRYKTFLMMAALTGLRASELRGLPWDNVDLDKGEVHVRQRADIYNKLGSPKSKHARRTVPLPRVLVQQLREWKMAQPNEAKKAGLVFCNDVGNIENLGNLNKRALQAACLKAGVHVPDLDEKGRQKKVDGKPLWKPKYRGMHALRHFHASWLANPKSAGGLELPMKTVQGRLGHSSMMLTADRYSHLFPANDDDRELADAADMLLGI